MSRAEFILANFDLLPEQVVLLEQVSPAILFCFLRKSLQANVTIIGGQLLDRDSHEYSQLLRHLGGAKAHLQAVVANCYMPFILSLPASKSSNWPLSTTPFSWPNIPLLGH
jgi:hypothetical protein